MDEEIKIDRAETLRQRINEIKEESSWIEIKFTYPKIPEDILTSLGDACKDKDGSVLFSDFLEKIKEFISENIQYSPLFSVEGGGISEMELLINYAIARDMLRIQMIEQHIKVQKELDEIEKNTKEKGDEE